MNIGNFVGQREISRTPTRLTIRGRMSLYSPMKRIAPVLAILLTILPAVAKQTAPPTASNALQVQIERASAPSAQADFQNIVAEEATTAGSAMPYTVELGLAFLMIAAQVWLFATVSSTTHSPGPGTGTRALRPTEATEAGAFRVSG